MRGLKFIGFGWTLIGNEAAKAIGVVWWSDWWWSVRRCEPVRCSQKLLSNRKTCRCPWGATKLVQKGWRCRTFWATCACQEAERSHVWNALARHWMLKYQEVHLMSKRMRSEDNWKELLGKSSAKWSLISGHLCEELFCAEDALGSLKQVCLSPFYPKIREIGAVRLSKPDQNLGSHKSNLYTNTIRTHPLRKCSLQAGCPHPGKRQQRQNNQNLGFEHRNLYTNTIRTQQRCKCSLQAGCPHPCKRQLWQHNQNLGWQPTRKK